MNHNFFITLFGKRLGFQYSPIVHGDSPYMTRFIVYLLWVNFRLHKFYRGDQDRVSHTHPGWFLTIPFASYDERVYCCGEYLYTRRVDAWWPHWRGRSFEHIVTGRSDGAKTPFWTFVVAGSWDGPWGFYRPDGEFIFWRDYVGANE